jgi:hypothetical protein
VGNFRFKVFKLKEGLVVKKSAAQDSEFLALLKDFAKKA